MNYDEVPLLIIKRSEKLGEILFNNFQVTNYINIY